MFLSEIGGSRVVDGPIPSEARGSFFLSERLFLGCEGSTFRK